jgi:hypothetical protein
MILKDIFIYSSIIGLSLILCRLLALKAKEFVHNWYWNRVRRANTMVIYKNDIYEKYHVAFLYNEDFIVMRHPTNFARLSFKNLEGAEHICKLYSNFLNKEFKIMYINKG